MESVDLEANATANKVLSVIFIIVIVLINFAVIFKTVRKGGFIYTPQSLVIISLAIGDIFLALFSLVVFARIYYEDVSELTCETVRAAQVYNHYFIHFVYAVGLMVLAGELIYRYKHQSSIENTVTNIIKSIILSAVPWLIALIIVLPVTLADTVECHVWIPPFYSVWVTTTDRLITMFGITVVLPVGLALIVCIVTSCMTLTHVNYTGQVISYQGAPQNVVIATHNTSNILPEYQYPINVVGGMQQASALTVPTSAQTAPPSSLSSPTSYHSYDNNQNSKLGQGPMFNPAVAQYPPPQYPVQQYFPQQQMIQQNVVVSAPVYPIQPQTNTLSTFTDPGREKSTLLGMSIILFICALPAAACAMGILDSTLYDSIDYVVLNSLIWWSNFRSILTPIVWLSCTRNSQ